MIHSNVVEYTIKNKQNTGDKGWSPAQNRIELLDITGVTKKNRNILILSQDTIRWLDVSTHNSSKTFRPIKLSIRDEDGKENLNPPNKGLLSPQNENIQPADDIRQGIPLSKKTSLKIGNTTKKGKWSNKGQVVPNLRQLSVPPLRLCSGWGLNSCEP